MLNRFCAGLLAAGWLLSSSPQATVLAPAEFREVVTGSDIIAYGRVIDATAELSDGRERVDTIVTLQVGTYLKGGSGDTIVFEVPGGQIGRYRDVIIGAPVFQEGDEAVVFLRSRGAGRPTVFGLNQGVFRVRLDPATRRRVIDTPPLVSRSDSAEPVVRGTARRRAIPLETFGAEVQSVLAQTAARRSR